MGSCVRAVLQVALAQTVATNARTMHTARLSAVSARSARSVGGRSGAAARGRQHSGDRHALALLIHHTGLRHWQAFSSNSDGHGILVHHIYRAGRSLSWVFLEPARVL